MTPLEDNRWTPLNILLHVDSCISANRLAKQRQIMGHLLTAGYHLAHRQQHQPRISTAGCFTEQFHLQAFHCMKLFLFRTPKPSKFTILFIGTSS